MTENFVPLKIRIVVNSKELEEEREMGIRKTEPIYGSMPTIFDLSLIGYYAHNKPILDDPKNEFDIEEFDGLPKIYDPSGEFMFLVDMPFDEFDKLYKDWLAEQDVSPVWVGKTKEGRSLCIDFASVTDYFEEEGGNLTIYQKSAEITYSIKADFDEFTAAFTAFKRRQLCS